jgi:hypothetical protein
MNDHDGNVSNPYHPHPRHCCERCVFGSGQHAAWCMTRPAQILRVLLARLRHFERPKTLPNATEQGGGV